MRVGMVEPAVGVEGSNPGWLAINAGARYVLRQALSADEFVSLPMLRPWTGDEVEAARECDVLVLSGNPRYDTGSHEWLYAGVIDQMTATGRPCIDAWAGASVPLGMGIEHGAALLLANDRNRALLDRLARFDLLIARDALAQRLNEMAGLHSIELPCSSWWAARELGVMPVAGDERVLIAHKAVVGPLFGNAGRRVIAVHADDMGHCESLGVACELVTDPMALLRIYSCAAEVVSCRVHAAIPAASLGCRTAIVAIDSRAQAGDAFRIPWAGPEFDPLPAMAVEPVDPVERIRACL